MKYLIHFIELLALFSCIINFKKLPTKELKWFLFLLLLTNIVEWGNGYRLFTINHSNNWISNIRNPIEFIFIGWFYSQIIENNKVKKQIKYLSLIIVLASLINFLFFQGFRYLNSYTIILGSCFCIYFIVSYLLEVMEKSNIPKLYKEANFWISMGFLFFYSGQSILLSFFQYFINIDDFESFITIWDFFITLINLILYPCISIAFFCRAKPTNTSLQE